MSGNDKFEQNGSEAEEAGKKSPSERTGKDKVGDILHKERVTKRITIETIAKDLKLNEKYIKAIESNNHDELPAAPYIRVYLRSMANYLMLDADDILEQYLSEKGIEADAGFEDNTSKVSIDVKEDSGKKPATTAIIISIIAALAVLSFISNQMGLLSTPEDTVNKTEAAADSIAAEQKYYDSIQAIPSITDSLTDSLSVDSTTNDSVSSQDIDKKEMMLTITSKRDSVWIQIFSDNKSWRNFIRPGIVKNFTAKDSFNVHVGNNAALKYKLNGIPHVINGKGVRIFKITPKKTELWTTAKWKSVFKDRL